MTLVCEDNQQILCHKVVLAASSSIIKDMHPQPPSPILLGGEGEGPCQAGGLHIQGPGAGLPV